MKFYNTNNKNEMLSFREAVIKGLAEDGGLYLPVEYPKLDPAFLDSLPARSIIEIGYAVSEIFSDHIPSNDLGDLVEQTISFDFPLVPLTDELSVLELFHGPTLAFKDLGARFLANLLSYYLRQRDKEILVLVATSGDTGSAVAHSFYGIKGITVCLLYPSGKVSRIQEQQLTTLGNNIHALEIGGSFDDCQSLVKKSFQDPHLLQKFHLTSANSINVARLLPQSFYYFYAFSQRQDTSAPVIFSVPCGNFGNLTAGLIAMRLGLPVKRFIAAVNRNAVFPNYMATGKFEPQPAIKTLSNAMDVGNPSNVRRIISLYHHDLALIQNDIFSCSISDPETVAGIGEMFDRYRYIIDPHGAVAYRAVCEYKENQKKSEPGLGQHFILLETAHPAKFTDIVSQVLQQEIPMPQRLASVLQRQKKSIVLNKNFKDLKTFLLDAL